jgi:hypothetical protein
VCVEAIELGYVGIRDPESQGHPILEIMMVARFAGKDPGAALVAIDADRMYEERLRCDLSKP